MATLFGPVMLSIADFPPNEETRRRARGLDIAPIWRYPKDRHQGKVLLAIPSALGGWAIGHWDRTAGAWIEQENGEQLNPTHFGPLPGETIEIDDA